MKSLSPPCSPVLVLRPAGEEEWTRVTASFDQICQEQICAFTRARWPASRIEPCLFFRDGSVVGGALMLLRDLPLGLGAIALCKLGPMLKDASAPDAFATYDAMVQLLVNEYATKRQMTLSILPQGFGAKRSQDFGSLLTRGFTADAPLRWPHRYTVALDKGEAEHRKCLAGKWRYHLKKSESAGLTFEHAGTEALPEFAALYETMSARKKFPDYSAYGTLPALLAAPEPDLRPQIFLVRRDGEVVAGAVIFTAGDTAAYLYGATTDAGVALRAGFFMQWRIIAWLKANTRAVRYELGGNAGFFGLHQFKKGLIGSAGSMEPMPPTVHYAARWMPRMIASAAYSLRTKLLELRGALLDRLRGQEMPDLAKTWDPTKTLDPTR